MQNISKNMIIDKYYNIQKYIIGGGGGRKDSRE